MDLLVYLSICYLIFVEGLLRTGGEDDASGAVVVHGEVVEQVDL